MDNIVTVSAQAESWRGFTDALKELLSADIITVGSSSEAISLAQKNCPLAMVIDQNALDKPLAEMVREIMVIDAMINVACLSDLPEDEFHEKTEGLGILMQLSPNPDVSEAFQLASRIRQVSTTQGVTGTI